MTADKPLIQLGPISSVQGKAVVVPGDDFDTDRIVPARYLKRVTFAGFGELLFYDERYDAQGKAQRHPLNDPRAEGASIMITGRNFGCGSSREHAPQALVRAGFHAVVAESFAEIFFGNALQLGLVCAACSRADLQKLAAAIEADSNLIVAIDVASGAIRAGNLTLTATFPPAVRDALLSGEWDSLARLAANPDAVRDVAGRLPYLSW